MSEIAADYSYRSPTAAVGFRINARRFAITWPRCDYDMSEMFETLKLKKVGSNTVTRVIISNEEHSTATHETALDIPVHRHALVEFSRKADIRDCRFFDFAHFHANVQSVRVLPAWIKYIKKKGDFLEFGVPEEEEFNFVEGAEVMAQREFVLKCQRRGIPYGYMNLAWEMAHSEVDTVTFHEDPNPTLCVPLPEKLSDLDLDTMLTNIIVGPAGCGKTTHAIRMMEKPILFVTHIDSLRLFDQKIHRSILFDDVSLCHLPRTEQIKYVDRYLPRHLHRRYGTTLVAAGVQVVFTGNTEPFLVADEAIKRRIKITYI